MQLFVEHDPLLLALLAVWVLGVAVALWRFDRRLTRVTQQVNAIQREFIQELHGLRADVGQLMQRRDMETLAEAVAQRIMAPRTPSRGRRGPLVTVEQTTQTGGSTLGDHATVRGPVVGGDAGKDVR